MMMMTMTTTTTMTMTMLFFHNIWWVFDGLDRPNAPATVCSPAAFPILAGSDVVLQELQKISAALEALVEIAQQRDVEICGKTVETGVHDSSRWVCRIGCSPKMSHSKWSFSLGQSWCTTGFWDTLFSHILSEKTSGGVLLPTKVENEMWWFFNFRMICSDDFWTWSKVLIGGKSFQTWKWCRTKEGNWSEAPNACSRDSFLGNIASKHGRCLVIMVSISTRHWLLVAFHIILPCPCPPCIFMTSM